MEVGDGVTLWGQSERGTVNTLDVTVVAIARDLGALTSNTAFTDVETLRQLFGRPEGSIDWLMLYLDDEARAPDVLATLSRALRADGLEVMPYEGATTYAAWSSVKGQDWQGQRLYLNTGADELQDFAWRVTAANGISALLGLVLVMVIVIGLVNSMLVTVQQRTREIGTLRALGMSRSRIVVMFVAEGLLLGFSAAVVGAVVAAGAAVLLDAAHVSMGSAAFRDIYFSDVLGFSVGVRQVGLTTALFTVAAGGASIWPALRAARQRPAAALRGGG